jgi:DNA-binding MarR family transcriptional regulator
MTIHPSNELDDVVHQRVRLGNLSQHLSVLEDAGLITVEKGYEGKRARTWITLTKKGRVAPREEIRQLKALISQIESIDGSKR